MKHLTFALVFAAGFAAAHLTGSLAATDPKPTAPPPPSAVAPNASIDMPQFLTNANAAAKTRESRRLSEADFIKTSQEEGVIVLDARSKQMYDLLHIKGAVNLSFPDINVETLKKVLPDKNAKILIYCNNNFTPAPETQQRPGAPATPTATKAAAAFQPKRAAASLNLSTYVALHTYGYTNVYELGPLVDPAATKIELVSNAK